MPRELQQRMLNAVYQIEASRAIPGNSAAKIDFADGGIGLRPTGPSTLVMGVQDLGQRVEGGAPIAKAFAARQEAWRANLQGDAAKPFIGAVGSRDPGIAGLQGRLFGDGEGGQKHPMEGRRFLEERDIANDKGRKPSADQELQRVVRNRKAAEGEFEMMARMNAQEAGLPAPRFTERQATPRPQGWQRMPGPLLGEQQLLPRPQRPYRERGKVQSPPMQGPAFTPKMKNNSGGDIVNPWSGGTFDNSEFNRVSVNEDVSQSQPTAPRETREARIVSDAKFPQRSDNKKNVAPTSYFDSAPATSGFAPRDLPEPKSFPEQLEDTRNFWNKVKDYATNDQYQRRRRIGYGIGGGLLGIAGLNEMISGERRERNPQEQY